ncbi:MAG TPA: hypothetical protein VM287_03840 [Egibacteraceae bacterium]|nr:hypothetical protein [Egibacteraceae bacterium]
MAGLLVGGAVAAVVAIAVEPLTSGLAPWSRTWGLLSGAAAFGLILMVTGRGRRGGALLATAVFALIGLGVVWFMSGFGYPSLWSPEGLWMWPLAVGSLLAAGILLVRTVMSMRRMRAR